MPARSMALAICAALSFGGVTVAAQPRRAPVGLWPMPRHDAANTARADVPGEFRAAPVEVWRYGSLGRPLSWIRPVRAEGRDAFLRQSGSGLSVVRPDGTVVWNKPTLGVGAILAIIPFPGTASDTALAIAGNSGYALIDLGAGSTLWTWAPPSGAKQGGYAFLPALGGGRLFAFPQGILDGFCFEFTRPGPPALKWRATYKDKYWANFGPYLVLADMDRDARADILLAGKPTYFAVIDTDTGAVKFDIHYPIDGEDGTGRPYGLLQATDLDADGYPEAVMVSCQVEEYVGIVRNEGGKAFKYAWSKWVEHDLPDDYYELRPNVSSFADTDADGKPELALGLFGIEGDKRWHTVVFDPLGGWQARRADLPDRYCWGFYDLDGDGRAELITSTETTRRFRPVTTLQVVDPRTFKDIATIPNVTLSIRSLPLPMHQGFFGDRASPHFIRRSDGTRGLLVRRAGVDGTDVMLRLADGKAMFEPLNISSISWAVMASSPGEAVVPPDLAIDEKPVAPSAGAYSPLVCSAGGRRELVMATTDLTLVGGVPDLRKSGAWKTFWKARGSLPTIWQAPDGGRRICAVDWEKDAAYILDPPAAGNRDGVLVPPLRTLDLPDPPLRIPGMLVPYGTDQLRIYIGLRTGSHTLSSGVWDGSGNRLWFDAKEGPYPRQPAVYQDGGRWMYFVDNHGKHMIFDESGAKRTVAHGWYADIPGRGDGAKYVLPIVGPFGPKGETRLVLSPGLEHLEILNTAGERLAKTPYGSIYERQFCYSAVGRLRGAGGGWDVASITSDGVFHCSDANTAQDRWRVDLGVKADAPYAIAAADIDSDGRDEFVVALPNGELVALEDRNGSGAILWKKAFDAGLKGVIVADVDGDRKAEIIVETDDFCVRVLKPAPRGRAKTSSSAAPGGVEQ